MVCTFHIAWKIGLRNPDDSFYSFRLKVTAFYPFSAYVAPRTHSAFTTNIALFHPPETVTESQRSLLSLIFVQRNLVSSGWRGQSSPKKKGYNTEYVSVFVPTHYNISVNMICTVFAYKFCLFSGVGSG